MKIFGIKTYKTKEAFCLIIPSKEDGYYAYELEAIINAFLAINGFNTRVINFVCELFVDDNSNINDEEVNIIYNNNHIRVEATRIVKHIDIIRL